MTTHRLLTAGDVRALLAEHGLAPRRREGQHFLVDPATLRAIVRDAGVQPGERVLEIGPGVGSLTLALREAGAHVVAVELDAGLVRACRAVVGDDPDVRLIHADALDLDVAEVADEPVAVVANLPYHAATPLLLRLLASQRVTRAHVTAQHEVGQRWTAGPGHPRFGAVSVKVAAHGRARLGRRVSRHAFLPAPRVDSVTVSVTPQPWTAEVARATVLGLVDAGFAQRRKQLARALAAAGWPHATVTAALSRLGLAADVRAERLDLDAWIALARVLSAGAGEP